MCVGGEWGSRLDAAGETAEDAGDSQGETAQAAFLYHNSGKSR